MPTVKHHYQATLVPQPFGMVLVGQEGLPMGCFTWPHILAQVQNHTDEMSLLQIAQEFETLALRIREDIAAGYDKQQRDE